METIMNLELVSRGFANLTGR